MNEAILPRSPRWFLSLRFSLWKCLLLQCVGLVCLPANTHAQGDLSERLAHLTSPEVRRLQEQLVRVRKELGGLPLLPGNESTSRLGWHSAFGPAAGIATRFLQVDLGESRAFDSVALIPVSLTEEGQERSGYGFPRRFRVEAADTAEFSQSTVLADFTDRDFPNPGVLPVVLDLAEARGRFIRVTATHLYCRGSRSFFALGELMVLQGEHNLAALRPVSGSDAYNNAPAWDPSNATDSQSALGSPVLPEPSPGNGYHSAIAKSADVAAWVQMDLGKELPLDEVRLFSALPIDFPARLGFGFPVRFRVEIGNTPDLSDAYPLCRFEDLDVVNPGANPVTLPAGGRVARYVRVSATKLWQRNNDFVFALSELQVFSGGLNVALGGRVNALDQTLTPRWDPKFLNDGFTSQGRLVDWGAWLRGLSRRRELQHELSVLEGNYTVLLSAALTRLGLLTLGVFLGFVSAATIWVLRQKVLRKRELQALRKRLAADLHDEIGSNLGSITLLSRLASDASRPAVEARADLDEIQRIAQETAESMRDIVWLLQPGERSGANLVLRMRETAAQLLSGTDYHFEAPPNPGPFNLEFERQLLLLFKEALNNIRKHARAKQVQIVLNQVGFLVQLQISDDGVGFDSTSCTSGLGLELMQQRAMALGGTLEITGSPGRGTRVQLKFQIL